MLLDFRKAKNTRLATRVFLRFSRVSQHLTCLDHGIQIREFIWYFLTPILIPLKGLECVYGLADLCFLIRRSDSRLRTYRQDQLILH